MKITRVMAALVCGAIVASSSSVAAFADGENNIPVTVSRAVEHGSIRFVSRVANQHSQTASTVTVQLIPEEGFEVDPIFNESLQANFPFTTGTYADQSIVAVEGEENTYTFEMPWNEGVVLTANFAQK